MTGGRLKKVLPLVAEDEAFCLTYGDGVADVDVAASIAFHRSHGELATGTAVPPPRRFGQLHVEGSALTELSEKPIGEGENLGAQVSGYALEPHTEPSLWQLLAGRSSVRSTIATGLRRRPRNLAPTA